LTLIGNAALLADPSYQLKIDGLQNRHFALSTAVDNR